MSEFRKVTTGACHVSVAVLLPMPDTCRFVGGNGGTVNIISILSKDVLFIFVVGQVFPHFFF